MSTPLLMNWKEVENRAIKGNPEPPKRIEKSQEQWKAALGDEVFATWGDLRNL